MSGRLRSIVTVAAIAGVTLALYGTRLGPPPALSADESALLLQAQSVATTGRDTAGRRAPLFFQMSDEVWLQPIPVYATAAFLRVTSTGEWGSRFATVRVAVLSAILMYFVGRRLYRHEWLAIATSALLVLTPMFYGHARLATDAVYPVPFVLLWLYCLLGFIEQPRWWRLLLAGLALGVGVYSQPAAPITMSFLAALSVPVLWVSGHRTPRLIATVGAGFVLPLLVMVVWFISEPDTYRDTMGRWAIFQAHLRNPLDGLRAFVNWTTLGTRASLYWGFYDPSALLFSTPDRGGVLRGAAPLLLPMAVLVPMGISQALKNRPSAAVVLLTGGLVIAPLAASTFGVPHNLGQAMSVAPFVVLVAGFGIERVVTTTDRLWRTIGLALLAFLPIQFAHSYIIYLAP